MYKSIILAVSAIASLAYAQSLPDCATSCITLPANCNGNPSCICSDAAWIAEVSCCISKGCNPTDQQAALAYANTICTPVGASLPTTASCANGTASTSGSASSSASAATDSAASSASSALNSITSSASGAASSAASSASSAASSASSAAFGNPIAVPAAGGIFGAIVGAFALL